MPSHVLNAGPLRRVLSTVLAVSIAPAPSASVLAQTYGAVQAVRQRVEGIGQPEAPPDAPTPDPPPQPGRPPGEAPPRATSPAGKIDTTFVAPNASVLIVLQPAQIMTSPNSQLLPTEVLMAAGLQYLAFDPAEIDEVIAFADIAHMMEGAYGITIKFKNPFRATSIPAQYRPTVQLGELGGKKYLKSGHPFLPSFYGPNNKTLVCAPDATLRPLVESAGQPKSSPFLDRVREVASGNELYMSVDMTSARAMLPVGLAFAQATLPPEAKQAVDMSNLITGIELTLNLATPGPVSFVVHANDEAAAQQIETMILAAKSKYLAQAQSEQPSVGGPLNQAWIQFQERMAQRIQPQRNGASVTCFHLDANDPAQQQLIGLAYGAILAANLQHSTAQASQPAAASGPPGNPVAESAAGPEPEPRR